MNTALSQPFAKRKTTFLLFAIVCLGSLLRLFGLGHESLWNDELSSCLRSSYATLSEVITKGVIPDVHPPGYQILLYYVENTIGDSAVSLRLPSAIAGILTIPIVFHIGRKLFSNSSALLASAMLAVSPVHIWLSQEARPYAILILLTTASVSTLLNLLSNLNECRSLGFWNSAGFILMGILLEYTHYFGLLIFLLEIAVLCFISLRVRRSILAVIGMSIAPLLAYIPWIPVAVSQSGTGSYITPPAIKTLAILFFEYMGWSKFLLGIFAVTISAAGFIFFKDQSSKKVFNSQNVAVPTLWLILPLVVSLIISFTLVPVFTIRNMMIALPAVFLLFAAAIHILFRSVWQRNTFGTAICFFMLFSLFFVRKHYTEPHRNQFREAAYFVAHNHNGEENTVIIASAWNTSYFDYYFERSPGNLSVDMKATESVAYGQFQNLIDSRSPNEVWLLWGHLEPDSSLIDSISSQFDKSQNYPFHGAGVWHFLSISPEHTKSL